MGRGNNQQLASGQQPFAPRVRGIAGRPATPTARPVMQLADLIQTNAQRELLVSLPTERDAQPVQLYDLASFSERDPARQAELSAQISAARALTARGLITEHITGCLALSQQGRLLRESGLAEGQLPPLSNAQAQALIAAMLERPLFDGFGQYRDTSYDEPSYGDTERGFESGFESGVEAITSWIRDVLARVS